MTAIEDRYRWMDYALCAQVDPDLWFPDTGDNGASSAAKKVCATCVVKAPCALWLASFSDVKDSYGIAGGMSSRGRRRVRHEVVLAEERAA